jgi:hypothetical protein
MNRDRILGQLDRDLACAIALGLVEGPHVVANLESVSLHDEPMRLLGSVRNWLDGDDPLDAATRDYLRAKRDASAAAVRRPGQAPWGMAAAVKARDLANERARQARDLGRMLLAERGVLAQARRAGMKLVGAD